jgi:FMN-dependent NADH-azoreductase
MNVLLIQSSAKRDGSTTRPLAAKAASRFGGALTVRDLSEGVPLIDAAWVGANFTPAAERTPTQKAALATSDALIAELRAADVLVIAAPVYNFGIPAALKAYIDQITRAGETFRYTESGPEGLLKGKRAVIVMASGGTAIGATNDFATGYLRYILGFIGVTDVEVLGAAQQMMNGEAVSAAEGAIARLAA